MADSFNPNASGVVYAIALQPDGKILVGGCLHTALADSRATAWHGSTPSTGLADSFDPGREQLVFFPSRNRPTASILVGGEFTTHRRRDAAAALRRLDGTDRPG